MRLRGGDVYLTLQRACVASLGGTGVPCASYAQVLHRMYLVYRSVAAMPCYGPLVTSLRVVTPLRAHPHFLSES